MSATTRPRIIIKAETASFLFIKQHWWVELTTFLSILILLLSQCVEQFYGPLVSIY